MQNKLEDNLNNWDYIQRYSQWMYDTYSEYVGEKVFDVGAGNGRMVSFYIDKVMKVTAADIFESQIALMKRKFSNYAYFEAKNVDILHDDLCEYKGKYDTVLCINVLEHLEDDYLAVAKMKNLLYNGGKIIILVPAWTKLYCDLDSNVNHYRRYDRGRLVDIAKTYNLRIRKNIYFNMFGIIPYWLKGRRKQKSGQSFSSSLSENNSKIYNLASIILEPIEKRFPPKWGLSELIVMEKVEDEINNTNSLL